MYRVYDSHGEPLKWRFSTWNSAHQFRCLMGRPDWKIKTTIKQQNYGESKRYYL